MDIGYWIIGYNILLLDIGLIIGLIGLLDFGPLDYWITGLLDHSINGYNVLFLDIILIIINWILGIIL